jgi:hypothetical protein
MKRFSLVLLALFLFMSLLCGCGSKECNHNWERISNYDQSTARDQCTKCDEIRLYTDPDSMPERFWFSGTIRIKPIIHEPDTAVPARECESEEFLRIISAPLWTESGVTESGFDGQFTHSVTIGDASLLYNSASGVFANTVGRVRFITLNEDDKATVNALIESLFPPS